jgi:hypothetical protein
MPSSRIGTPVSSRISRTAASASDPPNSTRPPSRLLQRIRRQPVRMWTILDGAGGASRVTGMDRALFATRLHEAAIAARTFAEKFIEEDLPELLRFRLRLNSSYDGNPRVGDEVVCPDDGTHERASELRDCSEQQVVDALWRDGRVPEWIDVAVTSETGSATLVQLLCCGRFTATDERLYHQREGRPPFHVTGPELPPRHQDGQRFSIHHRSECWSFDDVDHLRRHASKVWSLELIGPAFEDAVVVALPELPRMEILELKVSPLRGSALHDVGRHPKLRVLRIGLDRPDSFLVPELPELGGIELFEIEDLPARPWGSSDLLRKLPGGSELTFRARGALFLDGVCPPSVSRLGVTAKRVLGDLRLPARIESLCLHLSEMNDGDVERWLAGVKQIVGLDLGETPVSDAFVESLPSRFGLTYLNVVRPRVSDAAIARIAAAHPTMKLLPNLNPSARRAPRGTNRG